MFKCKSCKTKDDEIAYLRKMVDKLQAKFGIAPVVVEKKEEDEDKKPTFVDKDLGDL